MDIREGTGLPGSSSYYLSRGGGGRLPPPYGSEFKPQTTPDMAVQSNVGDGAFYSGNHSGKTVHGGDPVKKKKGRPRKYGPDGATNMSLALSTVASLSSIGPKRAKGRPPGSGWKQQLAPLGEWMNSSAGLAFTPYIIQIGAGEDIAAKILAFAQQRQRALCVLSANGTLAAVTLRPPPASSGSTVTYEGRFEMLSLTGSFLVSEIGGPKNRTGGLSISISSPDGHVIGGAIGGQIIAASPVQVVVCSFVHGNLKAKSTTEPLAITGSDEDSVGPTGKTGPSTTTLVTTTASSSQDPPPNPSMPYVWPPSSGEGMRAFRTGIDLMRR